jgi:hypothetical protein
MPPSMRRHRWRSNTLGCLLKYDRRMNFFHYHHTMNGCLNQGNNLKDPGHPVENSG